MYVQKGWHYDPIRVQGADPGTRLDYIIGKHEIGFVELPVRLVARVPVTRRVGLRAFVGPSLGIVRSAQLTLYRGDDPIDNKDVKDDLELSAAGGAGVTWRRRDVTFVLDGAYFHGLSTHNVGDQVEGNLIQQHVMRTVIVSLGARFAL